MLFIYVRRLYSSCDVSVSQRMCQVEVTVEFDSLLDQGSYLGLYLSHYLWVRAFPESIITPVTDVHQVHPLE